MLIVCCYGENFPKSWSLKKNRHLLLHTTKCNLAGCIWLRVTKVEVKPSARTMVLSEGCGGSYFQAHWHGWWEVSLPHQASLSLDYLTVLTTWWWETETERRRGSLPRWKPWSFYKLISELLSYTCHFLFARSESYLSSPHSRWGDLYRTWKRGGGIIGPLLDCQTQIES